MGQILRDENFLDLSLDNITQVSLPAPSVVTVGGQQFGIESDLICDLITIGFGGLDIGSLASNILYTTYAVTNGGAIGLVSSTSAFSPTGFSVSKEVGKFRTDGSAEVIKVGSPNNDYFTEIRFQDFGARGSSNTFVLGYVGTVIETGVLARPAQSATLGDTFEIMAACEGNVYCTVPWANDFGGCCIVRNGSNGAVNWHTAEIGTPEKALIGNSSNHGAGNSYSSNAEWPGSMNLGDSLWVQLGVSGGNPASINNNFTSFGIKIKIR